MMNSTKPIFVKPPCCVFGTGKITRSSFDCLVRLVLHIHDEGDYTMSLYVMSAQWRVIG
jgi:hypothetical protein